MSKNQNVISRHSEKITKSPCEDMKNERGENILHVAAMLNHVEMIHLLMKMKMKPNVKCIEKGRIPLHLSAAQGYEASTKLLIDAGSSVNFQDNDGNSPLHLAVSKGHFTVVDMLIESGSDVKLTNKSNRTPLELSDDPIISALRTALMTL